MLTGELRSKIDGVWNAFWAGGIANPLEVIEQITYLLFMRGLDEAHVREENRANRLGKPIERRIFPKGKDGIGKDGGVAYAGVSTAIVLFTKTNSGGTDHVWFYDCQADGLSLDGAELERPRTAQSFCVAKAEIAAAGYDLSINRYKEVIHQPSEHRSPKEIIAELKMLEKEIAGGLEELEGML
jgi:hypothetical protein